MTLTIEQINELKVMIEMALRQLYNLDHFLIINAVNERAIVFRFGIYFNEFLKKSTFYDYNLDSEYNRNLTDTKRMENFPKGIIPDLLIHKRNINTHNVLVIEFKGYWNDTDRTKDHLKISDFTNQNSNDPYRYGLGAVIEIDYDQPQVTYYLDNNIIE